MKYVKYAVAIALIFSIPRIATAARHAAVFRIDLPYPTVPPSSDFVVIITISSIQPVNAYRVILSYPQDLMTYESFDDRASIIDVWQSRAVPRGSGTIELAGGSTRPFSGQTGELGRLRFKSIAEGVQPLRLTTYEAYLADGKGTRAIEEKQEAIMAIDARASAPGDIFGEDTAAPEVLILSLEPDPYNSDQKLLNYQVRDTGSGVGDVAARYRTGFMWSAWQSVQNPAAVPRGAWSVEFRVVDGRGNAHATILYNWPAAAGFIAPYIAIFFIGAWTVRLVAGARRRRTSFS